MVTLGYLSFDTRTRAYFPSLRLAQLGQWVPRAHFGDGEIDEVMTALHEVTRETVTLSMQNGLRMQFLTFLPGSHPISLTLEEGQKLPLFGTAVGLALLSQLSQDLVLALSERENRLRKFRGDLVERDRLMEQLRDARDKGFALAYDRVQPDTGAIAGPVPTAPGGQPMVIAVAGLAHRIRANKMEIIKNIDKIFRDQFGVAQAIRLKS